MTIYGVSQLVLLTWLLGGFLPRSELVTSLNLLSLSLKCGTASGHWAPAVTPFMLRLRSSHLLPVPSTHPVPPARLALSGPFCSGSWGSVFWSVLLLHLILFPCTFARSCRGHRLTGIGFFSGWLILTQEFYEWGFWKSVNALKLYIFLRKA